jgi:glycosyltransferase involved in cell wall biosynthesis
MKILFWNPTYVLGGGLNLLSNLLEQLSQHSDVTSITAALNRDYAELLPEGSWNRKVNRVLIEPSASIESFTLDHDVVYMTWPHGVEIPTVAIPTVCIYQDTILLDAYGFHTTRTFIEEMERVVRDTLAGYNSVIVTSHYTKQRFQEIVGPEAMDRVSVLPHIASTASPSSDITNATKPLPSPVAQPASRFNQASKQPPYLLYPANVSEHKNHHSLLLALSKRHRADVQLVLCGYGTEVIGQTGLHDSPYINRLNKAIRDRGLQPGIDFVARGYVSDTEAEELLKHAMGLIMPTRAEGMGLPIHEALEQGLPVIASDIPVLREHYAPRSNAILWVDPDCPEDIAQAWDSLCNRHSELVQTARESNIGSGVSWTDIGCHTVAILRQSIREFQPIVRMAPKKRNRFLRRVEKSIKRILRRTA